MLDFCAITPHPPIVIPGIGQASDLKMVEKTIGAMEKLARTLEKARPETILLISPHAPLEAYSFAINSSKTLRGSLANFGRREPFQFENNLPLAREIQEACQKEEISTLEHKSPLDHGALVPLYYLTQKIKSKLILLSFSSLNFSGHFKYGKAIGEILEKSPEKIAVIASGDLSHRLTLDAPAGYSPYGKEFDNQLIERIKNKDIEGILNLPEDLVEEAGECGLRSIIIALGVVSEKDWQPEILSYEGPFGVGYLVAELFNKIG